MRRALPLFFLILAGCASAASSDPDAEVLQAAVSDPHFEQWLATCEGPQSAIAPATAPPAFEGDGVPHFYSDAIAPDLLASLRARNRAPAALPRLRYPAGAQVDGAGATNLPVVHLSLPGYDAARRRAAVAVSRGTGKGCLGAGYVVYLSRDGGRWRIDARVAEWVD